MKQAELLTVDEIAVVRSSMSAEELDRVAAKARDLRDWLRGFVTEHMGRPLKARALDQLGPVHDLLASDEIFLSLVPGPTAQARRTAGEATRPIFIFDRDADFGSRILCFLRSPKRSPNSSPRQIFAT